MSFKRTVSFVLSFLLVFSVFFGGTGIFSSVAAEGTPPFVGSTKAMKTSSGIFIQSYITVEKGVSTEVGFYADGANGVENVVWSNLAISGMSVPEPTTATLSLLALAGLAARRRRK